METHHHEGEKSLVHNQRKEDPTRRTRGDREISIININPYTRKFYRISLSILFLSVL